MAERPRWTLAVLLVFAIAGCKPSWPRYEAPDGSFSTQLPPPLRIEAERTEGTQRLLSVESHPAEDQAFLVQRRRPGPGWRLEPEGVLNGFCAEFAQARGYQISSDVRGTRLDGRQAQSCAFQASGLEIRIQVVAAGQCIYTLMVMWRGPPPDADRFLDGFRVKKDCVAEERARTPERADGG
jgi:hypothetical protein